MKTNIEYLKKSINNDEVLDERYMILNEDRRLDQMVLVTKEIKDLITTIKVLNKHNVNAEVFYERLLELVSSDLGSKNEFNCFINACDSTIGTINSHQETFKTIVDLYLEHRVMNDVTSREWIQALIDKGSTRSLGSIGENKVIEIAEKYGFVIATNDSEFMNNDFSISKYCTSLRDRISPDLDFGKQNKKLDIIIKAQDKYYYLEAKHIKETGGSQDKQINELINLIEINTESERIGIIAFLDGVYSNVLLDISEKFINDPILLKDDPINKLNTQKFEILDSLLKNPNSFWVNTSGLEDLLFDLSNV